MSRADDLRALADEVERHDALAAAYQTAVDAYRVDASEANRAAFKAAKVALVDNRRITRTMEARTGVGIGGDAFIVPATIPED